MAPWEDESITVMSEAEEPPLDAAGQKLFLVLWLQHNAGVASRHVLWAASAWVLAMVWSHEVQFAEHAFVEEQK